MSNWTAPPEIEAGAGETTDLSNALRLARRHHEGLRHCRGLGWLAWDGRRWAADPAAAELLAQRVPSYVLEDASAVAKLAAAAADKDARERLAKRADALLAWARATAQAPRLAAALRLAEPLLEVKVERLDTDPWALNCRSGTIDLRTGEQRAHRREDFITKLTGIDFDPAAEAPRFRELVEWAMQGRPSLVSYLHRAAGYSATGSTREQCLLFPYGGGANGKSTVIGAIVDTLGEDYAVYALPDLLTAAQGERHATELHHLRGARMVVCAETEDGRRLAVQRMKQLTGETRITARAMRQDPVTFTLTATLWLQSNHRPTVTEQTLAVWRRIRVIPFDAVVADVDKELPERLAAERSGILRWIVEGAVAWYRDGLGMPPEVTAAVEDYRRDSDTLGAFLGECCATGEDLAEPAMPLFEAYRAWCRAEGAEPLDARKFKGELTSRGFAIRKTRTANVYQGLTLATGEATA